MMDNRETIEMDDEGMMMSNQSEEMKMMNWNGTIDVGTIIAEAFKSNNYRGSVNLRYIHLFHSIH